MLFNSFHYLIFFPIAAILYFMVPDKKKHLLLLIASYYFYMSWKPVYLILILITTLVSYYSAKRIDADQANKKKYLLICVIINFGILFVFKYFNFFSSIFSGISGS